MRRQAWWRGWAMMWAVLQLALPAAASWADARVERESRAQAAHVESSSADSCRPLHAADCSFCQVLSHDGARAPHGPVPVIVALVRRPVSADGAGSAALRPGHRPPARAPPAA